jgi:DNA primase
MGAVDEVKARLDIVEVVSQYVRLQKAGRSFKAVCPFHSEKTPSFIVNPDRQTWHCFGACSTGGDVISFISRKENLDFGGALRLLADRAGVAIEGDVRRRDEAKTLHDVNEAASVYFHSILLNTPAALAYAEQRGLDRAAIADFHLGFSPAGWENLKEHLTRRGYSEKQLTEAGLLVQSERGTTYDRFRERLVFPIRDDRGRVVGFGARSMPGSAEAGAKYINTPQTPIFDKGSVLYALDRAKDEIRRTGAAVLVEGYMDVITAHQHGYRNVVASMGTSLTERQALLARRFAGTVVLAMDSDEAGNAASVRGIQVVASAIERGVQARPGVGGTARPLEIRVAALPEGVDPDDLVRADPTQWDLLVKTSRPVIDHLYTVVTRDRDMNDPRQRDAAIAELLPAIAELPSPVQQADWIQRLARGRVREDELWRQVRGMQRRRTGARPTEAGKAGDQPRPVAEYRAPREEFLLALLYKTAAVGHLANRVSEDLFTLSENRELFRSWLRGQTIEEDDPWLWEHYRRVIETRIPAIETAALEEAFLDCVGRLQQVRMKQAKEASALALAEGEAGVRLGQVASIARTWLETGHKGEAQEDDPERAAASRLLEDMEAGLRFHGRHLDGSRTDQSGRPEIDVSPG